MSRRVDVAVVGAGPAGCIAARALALGGATVVLADRAVHPRWKVCGCCLAARAVRDLDAEGLEGLVDGLGAHRPAELALTVPGRTVHLPLAGTSVVSRRRLDRALLDAAAEVGVEVLTGWSATLGPCLEGYRGLHLRRRGEELDIEARLVVGATGLTPLPGRPGVDLPPMRLRTGSRIGVGAVFSADTRHGLPSDPGRIHMLATSDGYLGVSVLEDGAVNLAGALDPGAVRRAGGVAEAVGRLLDEVGWARPVPPPLEGWRGTPALTRRVDPPGRERLLLVGDAAGYLEPFTGEGMAWAVASARALSPVGADVLARGWTPATLARWARTRRRTIGRRTLIRAVSWLTRHPPAARAALSLLDLAPGLARPLVHRATGVPASPAPPLLDESA